jgi:hypothetical protein
VATKTNQKEVSPEVWLKLLALVEEAYGEREILKNT